MKTRSRRYYALFIFALLLMEVAATRLMWIRHKQRQDAFALQMHKQAQQREKATQLQAERLAALDAVQDSIKTQKRLHEKEALNSALLAAAGKGDDKQVWHLLALDAFVDAEGEKGPALVYAAEQGHLSTIKLLLRAGAHLKACDRENQLFGGPHNRALLEAASEGHTNVVRFLLNKQLDKDAQDENGYNPLLCAANSNHWQTVRLLLTYGAAPNYQTRHYHNSALILASLFGNKSAVRMLLRYGAKVNLEDKYDHTALWYALDHKHYAIARLLRQAGAKQ